MTTINSLSAEIIKEKLLSAKGKFVKCKWRSNPKGAAAFKDVLLEKHTTAVIQAGVNYANLSSVKQGIEDGTRFDVQSLPLGEWYIDSENKNWFPYLILHKEELYLRLTVSKAFNHIPKSEFYVNGVQSTKQEFATYLTPSESKKLLDPVADDISPVFNIKLNNLLDIPEEVEE